MAAVEPLLHPRYVRSEELGRAESRLGRRSYNGSFGTLLLERALARESRLGRRSYSLPALFLIANWAGAN